MTDRPCSDSGGTTFHFSVARISKHGSPTYNGKSVQSFGSNSQAPGASHESYITRDKAAEKVAADFNRYLERADAVEIKSSSDRQRSDRCIRANALENFDADAIVMDPSGTPSIFQISLLTNLNASHSGMRSIGLSEMQSDVTPTFIQL
jgi:hypothetical protein